MAECDSEKDIIWQKVITGNDDYQKYLLYQIKNSISRASGIDMIVSFLMESGVKLLTKALQEALERGVSIRILTGNYLGITQPTALYMLKKELGSKVDLRFYNDSTRSFHPKAYIFYYEDGGEIYIGSSNVSKSALTNGIEWNYRLVKDVDEESFSSFCAAFNELFEAHSIVINNEVLADYSRNWHRPAIAKELDEQSDDDCNVKVLYAPRGAQIEALYALEDTRAEGANKALIQAATGIGKTYLAAFDSKSYKRILFVAHREEILQQARKSFANVRVGEGYSADTYGEFTGNAKDTDKSIVFASVATLGRPEYLNEKFFQPDYFEYIIVDEFHHAVTKLYDNILQYFKPQFLLGLTATPERMDGRDIYKICDYNVPYKITLQEGINKGMLVPFHYYGIYDEVDYSAMKVLRGKYQEKDLNQAYIYNAKRYNLIFKHYQKYKSQRALGFCCSREHAEAMAQEFVSRGVKAVAVYSGNKAVGLGKACCQVDRDKAISKLIKGEIQVIFSVDMFNEGVDIPSVDMVMFLRPTESPVVFLQQLGRGLRNARDKKFLTVLDFIGNYKMCGKIPYILAGTDEYDLNGVLKSSGDLVFPDDCLVDFDLNIIDMFAEMEHKKQTVKSMVYKEFDRVEDLLGQVPSRVELMLNMDGNIYGLSQSDSNANIFKHYLEFLSEHELLNAGEREIWANNLREFLNLVETTSMTKVYKMPVLMSFFNHGNIRTSVTLDNVLEAWKNFFGEGRNWKDLPKVQSKAEYAAMPDQKHIPNITNNPVKFLHKSGKGLFVKPDIDGKAKGEDVILSLNDELVKNITELSKEGKGAFVYHFGDIIEYRVLDYYRRRCKE